jgi:hypothetical protein
MIDVNTIFNVASQTWDMFNQSILFDFAKASVVAGLTYLWTRGKNKKELRNAQQALKRQDYKSHKASVIQLAYLPANQNIPNGSHPIMLQWQHRLGLVDVEAVFPDEIRAKASEYIAQAVDKCTHENPLVFHHLKTVVPEEEYPVMRDAIRNFWRLQFSAEMSRGNNGPLYANLQLEKGHEPEKEMYVAALVYDPDSSVKQLRVLWLSEEQVQNSNRIHKRHVVIESPNALTVNDKPDLKNNELQWVDLFNNTLVQLRNNEEVVELSRVGILTGNIKAIPTMTFN